MHTSDFTKAERLYADWIAWWNSMGYDPYDYPEIVRRQIQLLTEKLKED